MSIDSIKFRRSGMTDTFANILIRQIFAIVRIRQLHTLKIKRNEERKNN